MITTRTGQPEQLQTFTRSEESQDTLDAKDLMQ